MMVLAVNEDQVTPGVIAFVVVAALGVTLFFLIRSMNRHIARIEAPSEDDLRQAEWEHRQQERARPDTEPGDDQRPGSAHRSEADQNNA
jgi:hypothetical protein